MTCSICYWVCAVADVTVMTKFSKGVEEDAFLLWAIDSPELYKQILVKVKYKRKGWCKLATKAGNVSIIPCDFHRYS